MIRSPWLLFAFVFASSTWARASEPVVPVAPSELLSVLPAAPQDWTLATSEAETSLDQWLRTRATRVYKVATPPNGAAAPAIPANASVEISITDTGGYASTIADFADFKPGKTGPLERLYISNLPAQVLSISSDEVLTQALAAQRFLIEVTIKSLPNVKVDAWLRLLRFDALHLPATAQTTLPVPVRLALVDELHPERNRSYTVHGGTAASNATP